MKTRQTVIISGASSGIGAATAQVFARENFDLLLMGRDQARLNQTENLCRAINSNIQIQTLANDLKKINEQQLIEKINQLSPATILINNAGIYHQQNFRETTLEKWTELFEVNLLGSIHLTQIIWKIFSQNKKGSIVNVSSTLGIKPVAGTSAYSALKAAMINWTESLAIEGAPYNIRANVVCPGIIDTPIHSFHNSKTEKESLEKNISNIQLLKNLGKPEDVAEALFFLGCEKSKFTTASILNVDGGINIK